MKLKHRFKTRQIKKALRNNKGRIASVAAALAVFAGYRTWRAMRAH
jgi:hypothetical protein